MLLHIPAIIPPDMLCRMWKMGHGSEFIIADGNFPATVCVSPDKVIYLPSVGNAALLDAVLQLFPLDSYGENAFLMQPCGDRPEPAVWREYSRVFEHRAAGKYSLGKIERFAFYERAKGASFIVVTGEQSPYANILLKKGEVRGTE